MKFRISIWKPFSGVILLLALGLPTPARSLDLRVPGVQQAMGNWCWAATSSAVLQYYGYNVSQQTIANWACGGQNLTNSFHDAPPPMTGHAQDDIMAYYANITCNYYANSIDAYYVRHAIIDNRRPMFIRWQWPSGYGHVLVLCGCDDTGSDPQYVKLMNPGYGTFSVDLRTWVVEGGSGGAHHVWTHTLTNEKNPGPWAGPTYHANNVRYLQWYAGQGREFGYFTPYDDGATGLIYHNEHGWVSSDSDTAANLWMYMRKGLGYWVWTSDSTYPTLWSDGLQTWLWYYVGTGNGSGGWFYNYNTQQTEWR